MDSKKIEPDTAEFDLFSPTDFRYRVRELEPYLSEEASISYQCRVEAALARRFSAEGVCSKRIADEIDAASRKVKAREVYDEERRVKHETRALVNVIRRGVSDAAKPFVHLAATSFDIIDTANAMRYKDAVGKVILPDLKRLEKNLIELTKTFANDVQIGRTHGQHAEPITFGFFLSLYVSRLGGRIVALEQAMSKLVGKFSGAVGVYGPLSLAVSDPERFERDLLRSLGLEPADVSTQIVQAEPLVDLIHSLVSTFGVLANFSRDMRNLQRSEISEIAEEFSKDQVGSSTMPQKRNPIAFENAESLWKKFMPQMVTVYLDQVSEHQRDLTNSASQRYIPDLMVGLDYVTRRISKTIWNEEMGKARIIVDKKAMLRNLEMSKDFISAEPLYILLALSGHPDAHEEVRTIMQRMRSGESGTRGLESLLKENKQIADYLRTLSPSKRKFLEDPKLYYGLAPSKAIKVAEHWEKLLSL